MCGENVQYESILLCYLQGLLQSEIEGDDSDQVGFYGRCLLHANPQASCSDNDRDTDKANSETEREAEPTCARTEVKLL